MIWESIPPHQYLGPFGIAQTLELLRKVHAPPLHCGSYHVGITASL